MINHKQFKPIKTDNTNNNQISFITNNKKVNRNISFEKNLEECLKDNIGWDFFLDPVLADDGFIYERDVINDYREQYNSMSPMTRGYISNKFRSVKLLKDIVDCYMNINPDRQKQRYKINNDFNDNINRIFMSLTNGNSEILFRYTNFVLNSRYDGKYFMNRLFKYCNDIEVIKHVINNTEDITVVDNYDWNIFHYSSKYSSSDIIEYIYQVTKQYDFINKKNNDNQYPLHIACKYNNNSDVIIKLIEYGCPINSQDVNEQTPLELICRYNSNQALGYIIRKTCMNKTVLETVNINGSSLLHNLTKSCFDIQLYDQLLELGINFELQDNNGIRPIHYLSQYCNNIQVLNYFINNVQVDIECEDNNGWRPIHYACRYNNIQVINYYIDKGVNLNAMIKRYRDNDVNYLPINMMELNDNINNDECEGLISEMIEIAQIQLMY
jgi:ankyrin repeat protein